MLGKLMQCIGDLMPRRLGTNEDVERWANPWFDQCSKGHVSELAIAYDGEENRAAHIAKANDAVFVLSKINASFAPRDLKLLLFDTGKGAER